MSGKPVVVETGEEVELALSLVKLLDGARASLPIAKPKLELAKGGREVFHKMIASKIINGYQLEFVMNSGEVHYGFVIGLDDFCVQVLITGHGSEFEVNEKYEIGKFTIANPSRRWLILDNIETISENFFGVKHLTRQSQDELNRERRAIVEIARRWLNQ